MVFEATSKMDTKIPAIMKAMKRITRPGTIGELTGLSVSAYFKMTKLVTVEKTEMQNFAMNMNASANPSTNANLALFLRIKMKALRAEEQKLSLEMAM